MTQQNKIYVQDVQDLIAVQFPQWAALPIKETNPVGWDHSSFRLGNSLIARFPNAKAYAPQIIKEFDWLPILANNLSTPIPKPLVLGKPSDKFPFHWSISRWIEGTIANPKTINNLNNFAQDLAKFLINLSKISTKNAPIAGKHNFFRGGNLTIYNDQVKKLLHELSHKFNVSVAHNI